MSRASGSDRASRSNLVTTKVSPARQAANASRRPGSIPVRAGQAMVDVDAIITDTQRSKAVALSGEILVLSRYACVSHQEFVHSLGLTPHRPKVKARCGPRDLPAEQPGLDGPIQRRRRTPSGTPSDRCRSDEL